jgi:hypothetical protein
MLIEKISYKINWRNFKHGYSFFIPCLDTQAAEDELLRVTKRLKMEVFMKVSVEEGIKGLRVWRI